MSLPKMLKLLRESKKWKQEFVAEQLDISTNGYARMERGETALIHDKLEKLADIYQIKLSDLVSIAEGEKNVIINSGTISNYSQQLGLYNIAEKDVEHLQTQLVLKEQIIQQQADEIASLKKIISLLEKTNN